MQVPSRLCLHFSFLGSESNVGVERNRERPVDTCGNHETSGQLGVMKL